MNLSVIASYQLSVIADKVIVVGLLVIVINVFVIAPTCRYKIDVILRKKIIIKKVFGYLNILTIMSYRFKSYQDNEYGWITGSQPLC